ncbi:MAG TPA: YceI family protein [Elusimicrobiota bacterium]|nr:YceI family protein [Elusimicrobiota bacterium]
MRIKNVVLSVLTVSLAGGLFAAETYTVDPMHTTVGFSVRHLEISNVKGTFPKVSGTLQLDEKDVTKSSVEITIDAASINTNNDKRDAHLRTPDFFDTAKFPTATFKSKTVVKTAKGYAAVGDLTLKGVTKTVSIPFTLVGPKEHPMMPLFIVGVEGGVTINRRDFHIDYGTAAMVGDDVAIDLEVEFNRPNPNKK